MWLSRANKPKNGIVLLSGPWCVCYLLVCCLLSSKGCLVLSCLGFRRRQLETLTGRRDGTGKGRKEGRLRETTFLMQLIKCRLPGRGSIQKFQGQVRQSGQVFFLVLGSASLGWPVLGWSVWSGPPPSLHLFQSLSLSHTHIHLHTHSLLFPVLSLPFLDTERYVGKKIGCMDHIGD